MKKHWGGVGFLVLNLLSACSFVVNEREQYVRIETPEAKGAICYIEDRRGYHWWARSTPQTLHLEKGYPPLLVTCEKSGFYKTTLEINERYEPQVVGDFAADKVGYILPTWLHSSDQYPNTIAVWMRPTHFNSLEDMETWEREFWQYLRDEEARLVATDKTLKGYAERTYAALEKTWNEYDPPMKRVKRAEPLFRYVAPPPGMQTEEDKPEFPKKSRKDSYYSASDRAVAAENKAGNVEQKKVPAEKKPDSQPAPDVSNDEPTNIVPEVSKKDSDSTAQ